MSDHSISLVPKKSQYPHRAFMIKNILEWLVSRNIIDAEIPDCILIEKRGF